MLGVLRVIEWVREASARCPTLRYYYMGYYIHDCPKMRYKGEYKPSELRCAATGVWSDLDGACVRVLDAGLGFAPFAPGAVREEDVDADMDADVDADGGASRTVEERERVKVEGCTLGLVEGNRLARAANANASRRRASLPKETKAKLRARLGRWAGRLGREGVHGVPPVSGPAREQRRMATASHLTESSDDLTKRAREPARKMSSSATTRSLARISPCGCDETHARCPTVIN